jgi:hypothetical protein
VPDIKRNLDQVRSLPLKPETIDRIISKNALEIWPA